LSQNGPGKRKWDPSSVCTDSYVQEEQVVMLHFGQAQFHLVACIKRSNYVRNWQKNLLQRISKAPFAHDFVSLPNEITQY